MNTTLTSDQLVSIRGSYFNILALFLEKDEIETKYMRCLLKWGFQLHLSPDDLKTSAPQGLNTITFRILDKIEKMEAIYHLVYMIYLDKVVEDVELEVAIIYAEKLGLKGLVVSELFKSIATADFDQTNQYTVRQEVIEFLKLHEKEF